MTRLTIHHRRYFGSLAALLACGLSASAPAPPDFPANSTPKEAELGKEAAEQVAKRHKFVEDEKSLGRLAGMVKVIAPRSERPQIEYGVKIIDDDVVNAFTLPGGYLYVTRKLMDSARSDDELAGVVAHEIAHNARMHVLRLIAKQRKLQLWQLLAVVGAAAGGQAGADVGQMGMLIINGILNGYSQEAEREADESAITYLAGTSYSPVGLLTFMEYLADKEQRSPHTGDLGIFQTHPLTPERIRSIAGQVRELGIPLDRWRTAGGAVARAEQAESPEKQVVSRVVLGATTVCELIDDPNLTRGHEVAKRLNQALGSNLGMYSIAVRSVDGSPAVTWGGLRLVQVSKEDAEAQKRSPDAIAQRWAADLKAALWKDSVTTRQ